MQIQGKGYRVSIYIGENDHYKGQSLYMALLEFLHRAGASGATVLRGLAGYGAHSRIHTATIVTLSADLPIIVVWVDVEERVERLLPQIRAMVNDGLITVEELQVAQYAPGRRPDPLDQPVRDAMRGEVTTVTPDTPAADVVQLLLRRGYRSLPVVTPDRRLAGIITDGDLLRRAGLQARLGLQADLSAAQLQQQLSELQERGYTARDLMTQPVITVQTDDRLRLAVERMAEHGLKRLPVVDSAGRLAGLVSRLDVFRTVEYHQTVAEADETPPAGASVADLMYKEVATVRPDARLEEIVRALEANRRRRAVVVDDDRRVVGIITDGDLLRRSRHGRDPSLLGRLAALVTGQKPSAAVLPRSDETAAGLMTAPVITVDLDTPLYHALRLMLESGVKRLPVVDEQGRLAGILGRATVLRGLLGGEPPDG